MSLTILEWFGHAVGDRSSDAQKLRKQATCPFIQDDCTKQFNDGTKSGVCSVEISGGPLAICPNRLYAGNYKFLRDIAQSVFGSGARIVFAADFKRSSGADRVLVLGKRSGSELRLPNRGKRGGYFVDWILAKVTPANVLSEFVAVEVQTIDTTGSYKPEVEMLRVGSSTIESSNAGLNWENVSKRILPQLIYKGHVLRREAKCKQGLFFVCPGMVYQRISERLGGRLLPYENLQPGSISFLTYDLTGTDSPRSLSKTKSFSTTVDQVANAFVSPTNLPPAGSYEGAIHEVLRQMR